MHCVEEADREELELEATQTHGLAVKSDQTGRTCFAPRKINVWNSLPKEMVMVTGINGFIRGLDDFLKVNSLSSCQSQQLDGTSMPRGLMCLNTTCCGVETVGRNYYCCCPSWPPCGASQSS